MAEQQFLASQHKALSNILHDLKKFGKEGENSSTIEDINIIDDTFKHLWDLTYIRDSIKQQSKLYPENKELHYMNSMINNLCEKLGF